MKLFVIDLVKLRPEMGDIVTVEASVYSTTSLSDARVWANSFARPASPREPVPNIREVEIVADDAPRTVKRPRRTRRRKAVTNPAPPRVATEAEYRRSLQAFFAREGYAPR